MSVEFGAHEKIFALFTANVALVRTLSESGALDRTLFIEQLSAARQWLIQHGEKGALTAFDELIPMLTDA
ncbi:hypothetical protein SAMN06265365_1607 [Tistlia consotensis]|uniref:Uncharacterized protein n=1 Tax=Tistlia consotensis USBA 355 TaxID=560819 RepID=A0A1Y6CSA4_9PROT|nr:hypothetical protein [Tistlia consotensis]SMF85522.1 hypothetical protein SAMN05428998_1653 [Tistlia consotensis USBA 355]SNS38808.1 hypothetical protein SAMN06265365_1607 [Tistlia consotensis]